MRRCLAATAGSIAFATLAAAIAPRIAAADDSVPLLVNSASAAIDCNGRDVNVTSSKATLTFTGHCKDLVFYGTGTTATLESAETLQVNGEDTRLSVSGKAGEVHLNGRGRFVFAALDKLNILADGTEVEAKSIDELSVAGSRNTVRWSSGSPRINDIGDGNVLKPKS